MERVAIWYVDAGANELVLRECVGGILKKGTRVNKRAGLVGHAALSGETINYIASSAGTPEGAVKNHRYFDPYIDAGGDRYLRTNAHYVENQ